MGIKGEGIKKQNFYYKVCHGDVIYSIGYRVNEIVVTIYSDYWLLGVCGGHFVKYINVKSLCRTHEANIILEK